MSHQLQYLHYTLIAQIVKRNTFRLHEARKIYALLVAVKNKAIMAARIRPRVRLRYATHQGMPAAIGWELEARSQETTAYRRHHSLLTTHHSPLTTASARVNLVHQF